MIIMKFGGSALSSAKRIKGAASLVQKHLNRNPLVVLSAMGTTTDKLVAAAESASSRKGLFLEIIAFHRDVMTELGLEEEVIAEVREEMGLFLQSMKEFSLQTRDHLLSFGERLSVRIFAALLQKMGMEATAFDGWDAGIQTSSDFGRGEIDPRTYEQVARTFKDFSGVAVVTGFIGKDGGGNVTTLGRGGSDLTASVLGNALFDSRDVEEIQLWKDVEGILTADPRLVPGAQPIAELSFAEAAELAYFGAKVLHPSSILPAMAKGIPVRVKNYCCPEQPGTRIVANTSSDAPVVAMAHKRRQALVHIASTRMLGQWGFLAMVFQVFAELKISVDVIATSEVSISLTLDEQNALLELKKRLQHVATVEIYKGKALLSLIGRGLHSSRILEEALSVLRGAGIAVQMVSHGASKINTSLIIEDEELQRGMGEIYENCIIGVWKDGKNGGEGGSCKGA